MHLANGNIITIQCEFENIYVEINVFDPLVSKIEQAHKTLEQQFWESVSLKC